MGVSLFQDVRFFFISLGFLLFADGQSGKRVEQLSLYTTYHNLSSLAQKKPTENLSSILASSYFKSTITSLERRFEMPSTTVAMVASCHQIGNIALISFVSYYGNRWHRPRAIAIGSILVVIGYVIMVLPQFLGERYHYSDASQNVSTTTMSRQVEMCDNHSDAVDMQEPSCDDGMHENLSSQKYFPLFFLGSILVGIGATPLQPLGISYVDDYAHPKNAPVYVGSVTSIGLIGPAIGFILGSVVLKIWVDIIWTNAAEVTITPEHPSWVGAWWLGFIIGAVIITIATIPFWFFPRVMKKQEYHGKINELEENTDDASIKKFAKESEAQKHTKMSAKTQIINYLKAFKRILGNAAFITLTVKWWIGSIGIVGLATFFPKYLEVQFGATVSQSNMFFGTTNIPCLVIGTLLGSFIMKRRNLSVYGMAKLILLADVPSTLFLASGYFIKCDNLDIAGVTVPYQENLQMTSLISSCKWQCECNENIYAPVCGEDNITYLSPCSAGCKGREFDDFANIEKYTECSCINTTNKDAQWSTPGQCQNNNCKQKFLLLAVLNAISALLGGISATPSYMLLLRIVKKEDKSFAIGFMFMIVKLMAWMPGPVLYGAAIDKTCLHWTFPPCSNRGYCRIYDKNAYRVTYFSILLFADTLSAIAGIILCFIMKRQKKQLTESIEIKLNKLQPTLYGTPSSPQVGFRLATSSYEAAGPEVNEYENEENSFLAMAEKLHAMKETEIFA